VPLTPAGDDNDQPTRRRRWFLLRPGDSAARGHCAGFEQYEQFAFEPWPRLSVREDAAAATVPVGTDGGASASKSGSMRAEHLDAGSCCGPRLLHTPIRNPVHQLVDGITHVFDTYLREKLGQRPILDQLLAPFSHHH
jgi:hypothetical protein